VHPVADAVQVRALSTEPANPRAEAPSAVAEPVRGVKQATLQVFESASHEKFQTLPADS